MAALSRGASYALPASLMTPGASVIMAEVSYDYAPAIHVVMGGALTLSHTEYRRPRVVDPITFDD
jgi:hypothetical protein